MSIKTKVKKAVKVVKAVATGVADYHAKNMAVHKEALNSVGAEQRERIDHAGEYGAKTPMGTNAFYGKAEEKAKQLKQERGISLRSSVRSKLGL